MMSQPVSLTHLDLGLRSRESKHPRFLTCLKNRHQYLQLLGEDYSVFCQIKVRNLDSVDKGASLTPVHESI